MIARLSTPTHSGVSRCVLIALAILTALVAPASVPAHADTFTNPIIDRGGDPWVTQWQGQYFYTRTTGGNVEVSRSPWLPSVHSNVREVWDPPRSSPYGREIWAPELHRLGGKWYIYVAADDGQDINHRMFVLEGDSQDPQGSYTFKGPLSIPHDRWAIDGTVLEHGGKDYFIWSARTYFSDRYSSQSLYIAEMANPWTLTGNRTRISTPTYSWERHGHSVNEGPQILRNDDGEVLLTYSASGFYTPDYAIGALRLVGDDPLDADAWDKHSQPLFDQGNGVEGTGHASFVTSPDGTEHWIVYHARTAPGQPRDVRIQPFTFGDNGLPDFGEPLPTGQPHPAPSGTPLVTFIPNGSFERGGHGWLDNFHVTGDAGAADNDGTTFSPIAGGDGPGIGYLGAGTGSSLHQDIGPLHAGVYTLSLGLAVGGDDLAALADLPAEFILRLESIGLHPGGSANEADKAILASLTIDSSDLTADAFTLFDVAAIVQDADRVGTWLRVALYAPGGSATHAAAPWHVLFDGFSLTHTPLAPGPPAAIPEPTAAAIAMVFAALIAPRRRSS